MSASSSSSSVPPTPRGETKEEKKETIKPPGSLRRMRGRPSKSSMPSLPPTLQVAPPLRRVTYRYLVETSGSYAITVHTMLGALGGICTAANSKVNSWSASFKIRKVTVWPPSTSTPVSCSLTWTAGSVGQVPDEIKDGTIPEGITSTKALVFQPPARSLCGYWIDSTDVTSTLFDVLSAAGAVIDLMVDYRLCASLTSVQSTIAAGTLGTVYYLALDGPASNKIVPTSLPSTS